MTQVLPWQQIDKLWTKHLPCPRLFLGWVGYRDDENKDYMHFSFCHYFPVMTLIVRKVCPHLHPSKPQIENKPLKETSLEEGRDLVHSCTINQHAWQPERNCIKEVQTDMTILLVLLYYYYFPGIKPRVLQMQSYTLSPLSPIGWDIFESWNALWSSNNSNPPSSLLIEEHIKVQPNRPKFSDPRHLCQLSRRVMVSVHLLVEWGELFLCFWYRSSVQSHLRTLRWVLL